MGITINNNGYIYIAIIYIYIIICVYIYNYNDIYICTVIGEKQKVKEKLKVECNKALELHILPMTQSTST